MRRFRKSVAEARILPIVRQKRWFTSKSEVRRINKQKAIRKARRNAAPVFPLERFSKTRLQDCRPRVN